MKTSYYARLKGIDQSKYTPVAISGDEGKLVGFVGRAERTLSPYTFFRKWKEKETQIQEGLQTGLISKDEYNELKSENQWDYIQKFYSKVLKSLNPQEVYQSLGENAVLLCFEKPTEFCHRHLVASWLEMSLGVQIDELGFENDANVKENKETLKQQLAMVVEMEEENQWK